MRKLLYIFIATILFTACAGSGRERGALDAAQAVINDSPDSALAMLFFECEKGACFEIR